MRVAVVTRTARAEDAERSTRVEVAACRAFLAALPVGSWVSDPRGMAESGDVLSQVASGWTDGGSREALRRVLETAADHDLVLVHRMDRISRHPPTAYRAVEELRAVGVRLAVVNQTRGSPVESLAHLRRAAAQG